MSYYQKNQPSVPIPMSPLPSAPVSGPGPVKKPSGCLVVFLGFMLALSLVTGIFLVNLRLTFLSPTFWKNWLAQSESYERVGEVLLPNIFSLTTPTADTVAPAPATVELSTEEAMADPENYFSPAVEQEIADLLQDSISPYWLQQQSENALDSFFLWAHGRDQNLRIVFDLRALQGPFTEGFLNIAEMNFNEMPICPATTDPQNYDLETADCRPPEVDFATLREEFLRSNPQSVGWGYFPDEYVVDEAVFLSLWQSGDRELEGVNRDVSNLFANPPRWYQILMVGLVFTLILVGVFAALLIWLQRHSWQASTKVLGIAALIPAAIILIFSLLIYWGAGSTGKYFGVASPWQANIDKATPALTSAQNVLISDFALPLLTSFIKAAVLNIVYMSAVVVAVAIVLLVISRYGSTRQVVGYDNNEVEKE